MTAEKHSSVSVGRRRVAIVEDNPHPDYVGLFVPRKRGWRIHLFGERGRAKWSTLWHELLHALSGAALERKRVPVLTEAQVLALEEGFADLCRRNPRLMLRLVKELSK